MRESLSRRLILWGCSTNIMMLLAVGAVILYIFLALMSPGTLPNSSRQQIRLGPIPSQSAGTIPITAIVTALVNPLRPAFTPTPTFFALTKPVPPIRVATATPTP